MIKSGLNYTGRKGDLMEQIIPYLPKIKTLGEPFCGSCEFSINVNAATYILDDINKPLVELLKYFRSTPIIEIMSNIDALIEKYNLNNKNKTGYLELRQDYNKTPTPNGLYTLIAHSFSNQIRFNKQGEFNLPFGKRTFNYKMRGNLIDFLHRFQGMSVQLFAQNYLEVDWDNCDFVYCDPPYSIGTATYNENGAWTEKDDTQLFNFLDNRKEKWMLSNVAENKGLTNEKLVDWMQKYNCAYLAKSYKNSNYQRKQGGNKEVLVWNF